MIKRSQALLLVFGLAFGLAVPGLTACKSKKNASKGKKRGRSWRKRARKARPIHAYKIKRGDIEAKLSGTTTLTAEEQVTVVTQISGMVRRVYGKEGRTFRRGAVLASLSNPYLKIAYDRAKLQVKKLTHDLKRNTRLQRKGYVSKQTSEDLQFSLSQAKNELNRASQDLRNLSIRATIRGIVTKRHLHKGAWVSPQKSAFDLEAPKSLVAIIAVPEKFMPRLRLGLQAQIRAEALGDATPVTGKAIRISPIVDAKTGTIAVTIGNLNPLKKLRSGMFLTAHLILERRKQVPLIPKQAVLYTKNKPYVFRLIGACKPKPLSSPQASVRKKVKKKADCSVQKVYFAKGLENASHVEAISKVKPGDRVITLGQQGLQKGSKVRVIKIE